MQSPLHGDSKVHLPDNRRTLGMSKTVQLQIPTDIGVADRHSEHIQGQLGLTLNCNLNTRPASSIRIEYVVSPEKIDMSEISVLKRR